MRKCSARLLCLVAVCLLPIASLFAQEAALESGHGSIILTLKDAVEQALSNNQSVRSSAMSLESAKRTTESYWNVFLPTVSATARLSNNHTLFSIGGGKSTGIPGVTGTTGTSGAGFSVLNLTWNTGVSASLTLNTNIPYQLKQNTLSFYSALTSYRELLATTEAQTAQYYYNLIAAQENLAILRNSQKLAERQLAQTQTNYRHGVASELELLQAQYSAHSYAPQIAQAENAYRSDMQSFKLFLGYDTNVELVLSGDIETTRLVLPEGEDLVDLVERSYQQRFDMEKRTQALTQAELRLEQVKAQTYKPSFSVGESLDLSLGGTFGTGNPTPTFKLGGTLSASMSLPLTGWIKGSSGDLNVKNAEDSVTSARMSLESTAKTARQSILSAVETNKLQWDNLTLAKESLELSKRTFELSEEGYRNGLVSQTNLEEYRQRWQNAQQSVLRAEVSYINSVYSLANALNVPVEELYLEYAEKPGAGSGK